MEIRDPIEFLILFGSKIHAFISFPPYEIQFGESFLVSLLVDPLQYFFLWKQAYFNIIFVSVVYIWMDTERD